MDQGPLRTEGQGLGKHTNRGGLTLTLNLQGEKVRVAK